jgi:endonuclease-8
MPEGDTIFRAARTLHRALAGATVTRFESALPRLNRVHDTHPLTGRRIERVESKGKHLLIRFSGGLVLHTHMRMHGSWHIYRPGERWRRPRADMRIAIETAAIHAIAFNVPVAGLMSADAFARDGPLRHVGADPLAPDFDRADAANRLAARPDIEIAEALLDQSALAGVGNVFKSEILFVARVNPFARVRDLDPSRLAAIVETAVKLLRINASPSAASGIATYAGLRRTTGRADPSARLWVYGRGGRPCRRCGAAISRRRQGPYARATYWCPACQAG